MKQREKFKGLKIFTTITLIAAVICVGLILEPSVGINGFARLDTQKLDYGRQSPVIYDGQGKAMSENLILGRVYAPINIIPTYTVNAFVSIEDKRFFDHAGIDYYRIVGAAVNNVKSGMFSEGGSTITQQLVKNTHLNSDKNIKRKLMEMRIATDIERRYSKNEIIEMYLNAIYFGNNIYGIGRAAISYFDKTVEQLSLNESAMLAGIINNPSKYNPVTNAENANSRRRLVLEQMQKQRKITKEEYEQCVNQDISVRVVNFDQYASFLANESTQALDSNLFLSDCTIYTYLDQQLQSKINKIINSYEFGDKDNAITHAIVMNRNAEVLANCSNVNISLTKNYRQPGSVIKPAFSYAPALEKKLITPLTPILDEPTDFDGYTPENYKNKNYGWISASDALKYSQNIPAVKLAKDCGINYCKTTAEKLGYTFDTEDKNLALALGGMSKGVLLTQMANSYQAFANGGKFIQCSHIKKIVNSDGITVYLNPHKSVNAISDETAYFINDMLRECAFDGTAKRIGKTGINSGRIAAKTGTVGNENGNSDAYIIAYTRDYVVAVWIGAKNGLLSNGVTGGTHPTVIAQKILELLPLSNDFDTPESIVAIDIDKNEYKTRQKIVIASPDSPPRDKIKAKFSRSNIPKTRKSQNNYMLDTEQSDLSGFKFEKNYRIIE